jgi:hypothetical protein
VLGNDAKAGTDFNITGEAGAFTWETAAAQQAADPITTPNAPAADDELEIPACLRLTEEERAAGRAESLKAEMERKQQESEARRGQVKAAKAAKSATKAPTKISLVLHAVLAEQGITNAGIREMTGWKLLGGFFTGCKKNNIELRRVREDGDTRWFGTQKAA